jgi:hypothetical protein
MKKREDRKMTQPLWFAEFFSRAGLLGNPKKVIGKKFRFFHDRDGGYELGGTVEQYEVQGEISITLQIGKPRCHLLFSAVDPPYGDGVFRWRLIDSARKSDLKTVGELELL